MNNYEKATIIVTWMDFLEAAGFINKLCAEELRNGFDKMIDSLSQNKLATLECKDKFEKVELSLKFLPEQFDDMTPISLLNTFDEKKFYMLYECIEKMYETSKSMYELFQIIENKNS